MISVCVLAAAHRKPWMVVFCPQEFLLGHKDQTDFDMLCSACVGFAWLWYALGEVSFGAVYVAAAIEWAVVTQGAGALGVGIWLGMWPLWYLAPWLPLALASATPLAERKYSAALLRLPLVLVAIT